MRTTLNIEDKILEKASRLTGIKEKTSLVHLGLEALIAIESSKRLAKLGGTENSLRPIPRRKVMCHPFIIGELACGNLKNRDEIISLLHSLPMALTVEFDEFLLFIDQHNLMGRGVAFVDVHLLASAQLTGVSLWTADKRLKSAADQLELTFRKQ